MKLSELESIIGNTNFEHNLEEYIYSETLTDGNNSALKYNPFSHESITNKLILTTVIRCTIIISSFIYLLYNKEDNK